MKIYIKHIPSGEVLTHKYDGIYPNGTIWHDDNQLVLGFDGKVYSIYVGINGDYIEFADVSDKYKVL